MKRRFQGLKETPHFVQKSWMNPMRHWPILGAPIIFVQLYKIINIFPYRHNSVFGVRSQNIEELSQASVAGILGTTGYLLTVASSVLESAGEARAALGRIPRWCRNTLHLCAIHIRNGRVPVSYTHLRAHETRHD